MNVSYYKYSTYAVLAHPHESSTIPISIATHTLNSCDEKVHSRILRELFNLTK